MSADPLTPPPLPTSRQHVGRLMAALGALLDESRPGGGADLARLEAWGVHLAAVLVGGGRLLACGNGGSAADAQHLTAELVGRYRDDRRPLSALALSAETSSVTAIANDFGYSEVFARQVAAHGRRGDVLMAISTSGASPNVLAAARTAARLGMTVWALTGPRPNLLAEVADDAVAVRADATATIQEVHGTLIHALCATVDREVLGRWNGGAGVSETTASELPWLG